MTDALAPLDKVTCKKPGIASADAVRYLQVHGLPTSPRRRNSPARSAIRHPGGRSSP
jgi:hypothetical protein